jgi:2-amino-4-hydroxy-6-hydroxymethyldihydropteridine diphosphokinase
VEYGLSLGSNLGDRLALLKAARDRVAQLPGVSTVEASAVYETEPVGVRPEYEDQPYLNAVLAVISTAHPNAMSEAVHAIEADLGRVRTEDRFAPRPIDIDILYAGDTMMEDEDLTLPHPRWAERRFVVQPLADIRPRLVFPGDHQTVRDVLRALPAEPAATRFTAEW